MYVYTLGYPGTKPSYSGNTRVNNRANNPVNNRVCSRVSTRGGTRVNIRVITRVVTREHPEYKPYKTRTPLKHFLLAAHTLEISTHHTRLHKIASKLPL